jgi:hypothetical protein
MKTIKLITLISLLTLASLASNIIIAGEKLPFVGTKSFNFYGGSGTGQSISIKKNGDTVIKLHGTSGTEILYKGKFSNPIKSKDGTAWLLKDDKIYSYTNGKIDNDCMGDGTPCVSEFF